MKYRKKPVVIDAFQLTPELAFNCLEEQATLPFRGLKVYGSWNKSTKSLYDAYIDIKTLEGTMRANLNDWIIKGVKGELYPCKPDIFEATYELVQPNSGA